jgi:hypothetical protein
VAHIDYAVASSGKSGLPAAWRPARKPKTIASPKVPPSPPYVIPSPSPSHFPRRVETGNGAAVDVEHVGVRVYPGPTLGADRAALDLQREEGGLVKRSQRGFGPPLVGRITPPSVVGSRYRRDRRLQHKSGNHYFADKRALLLQAFRFARDHASKLAETTQEGEDADARAYALALLPIDPAMLRTGRSGSPSGDMRRSTPTSQPNSGWASTAHASESAISWRSTHAIRVHRQ